MTLPRGESYSDIFAEVERLRKEEAYLDQQTKSHLEGIKKLLGVFNYFFSYILSSFNQFNSIQFNSINNNNRINRSCLR